MFLHRPKANFLTQLQDIQLGRLLDLEHHAQGGMSRLLISLEAVGLQVLHPQVAAAAVGVFPDLHCGGLRQRSALSTCDGQQGGGCKPLASGQGSGFGIWHGVDPLFGDDEADHARYKMARNQAGEFKAVFGVTLTIACFTVPRLPCHIKRGGLKWSP